jgi:putative transcriptional regulator
MRPIQPKKRFWMRKLRLERDLTTRGIANEIGISFQHYNDIETGRRNPSPELSLKMAKYFEVPVEMLLEERTKFKKNDDNEMPGTCNMCDEISTELIKRRDGDYYCQKCHEENCEHIHTKSDIVTDAAEIVIYCVDCGKNLC